MVRYFLLANIAIVLHYLLYKLLLQNDTFFSLKRIYLLFAILFSLLFPIVWWTDFCIDAPETFNGFSMLFLNKSKTAANSQAHGFNTQINQATLLYCICVGALLLQFFLRILSILKIKRKATKTNLHGYSVYVSEKRITPFTFFNMIFIDKAATKDKATLELILKHEYIHKAHFHSLDTIGMELISIFLFFNPFVWLLKKELLFNLECIADNGVKKSASDLSAYQYAIVNTAISKRLYITNQFNISQLKKRIIMLNKQESKKNALLKYTSILPITLALLLVSHLSIASNTLTQGELLNAITEKAKEKATVIEWLNPDANLGEIAKGKPATATYEFVNHGDKPVIITNVKTSCGCTSKSYTKEPIQPGQKGTVKATYNAAKVGTFYKTVTVTTNDGSAPKVLKIRGVVVEK